MGRGKVSSALIVAPLSHGADRNGEQWFWCNKCRDVIECDWTCVSAWRKHHAKMCCAVLASTLAPMPTGRRTRGATGDDMAGVVVVMATLLRAVSPRLALAAAPQTLGNAAEAFEALAPSTRAVDGLEGRVTLLSLRDALRDGAVRPGNYNYVVSDLKKSDFAEKARKQCHHAAREPNAQTPILRRIPMQRLVTMPLATPRPGATAPARQLGG